MIQFASSALEGPRPKNEKFMKNIKTDSVDSLRPEYNRSDFGELERGKYANSQVEFQQLVEVLMACLGEDLHVEFVHHSIGNHLANRKNGDWTYEIDNGNQITLRYWLTELKNVEEHIVNPPVVMTSTERSQLQEALQKSALALTTKVSELI